MNKKRSTVLCDLSDVTRNTINITKGMKAIVRHIIEIHKMVNLNS